MRMLLTLLMLMAITWSAALLWFVGSMPSSPADPAMKTEAIVVLTGGKGRVERGFEMLAQGAAPVLFISGVGEHVTVEQILAEHTSAATRDKILNADVEIILDHVARSTVSNADQTSNFLRERRIRSIRLITANYHMKRSMHEFMAVSPGVTILPDAVFPDNFERAAWWAHENTRRLVFSEFYKYWAVVLRDWVRPNPSAHALA